MERIYLDSSILLSRLLREDTALTFLDGEAITSEIAELECRRTLDRIRHQEQLGDEEVASRLAELGMLLRSTRIIRLTSPILKRAKAPFPTVVRSLDAIHLATAELAKCSSFITHDRQQETAAKALGFRIVPIVS